MDSLLIGIIATIGVLATFIIAVSLPIGDNVLCDIECKRHYESLGFSCWQDSFNDYSCRTFSEHRVDAVIPWGSTTMPNERNFIPSSILVSFGINNTVTWTNADDFPHEIESDNGLFRSPILKPNQTWSYVFERTGHYGYHGVSHPWLKGEVNVVPLDPDYHKGQPITLMVLPDFIIEYHLVRNSDRLGYLHGISIIDDDTIQASFKDYPEVNPNSNTYSLTMNLGDKVVGGCYTAGKTGIYYLTFEQLISIEPPVANFREDLKTLDNKVCNFEELIANYVLTK